jgi:hypothetical protein
MKAIYLIAAIALMLVPLTSASYAIYPETKGWSLEDITDSSYPIHVVNTDKDSTVQITAELKTFPFIQNVTVFQPVPAEFFQYLSVTPDMLNLGVNESGDFIVHVAFPDLPEMYGHTWEFRVLLNDTNKYNLEDLGLEGTQKTAVVRLFVPLTKPIKQMEIPFYMYPFMIIFSLIFLGGLIIYLRKRSVPLAMKDHATTSSSEWAGMDVGSHPNEPVANPEQKKRMFRKSPSVDREVLVGPDVPKVFRDLIEDPTLPEMPQRSPVIIRKPLPLKDHTINGERPAVPKRSHQKKPTTE